MNQNNMYDISFIMPICDINKHYFNRLQDMKKYGFLNIGSIKIIIKLLIGPGESFYNNSITDGWPEDVTVKIIETPYLNVVQKILYYYQQLTDDEILSARWHAKIDDDAANDISKLVEQLDDQFDFIDRLYLVTVAMPELEEIEREIISKMGKSHWLNGSIKHEWEACFVSQPAMMSLKNNKISQEYINLRILHPFGYGDQPVGIALKFCKISAIEVEFASQFSKLEQFTLFGGNNSHIHFFRERGEGREICYQFFKKIINSINKKNIIENNKYKCLNGIIEFLQNNKFKLTDNDSDERHGIWCMDKNDIEFAWDDDWHEHSVIHKLFLQDDQYSCHVFPELSFNTLKKNNSKFIL